MTTQLRTMAYILYYKPLIFMPEGEWGRYLLLDNLASSTCKDLLEFSFCFMKSSQHLEQLVDRKIRRNKQLDYEYARFFFFLTCSTFSNVQQEFYMETRYRSQDLSFSNAFILYTIKHTHTHTL